MKYKNPIIPGFYPDPSICKKDGIYYLVNSSFEYFPGVPIFKSTDLVNWEQIGNCLTRKSQFDLKGVKCSGGIFAPTIRYYNGLFYMITTCVSDKGLKNFYVYTNNPENEWSDPIYIEIEGIDPSFFWEDGRSFVQYSYSGKIFQVEIELSTGEVIEGPHIITKGCGGRDTEGPHMFQKDGFYYLILAEGGTREGHMVTMMRGKSLWGPFEPSPYNPVVSNKDKSKEVLQCIGHADLICDENNNSYLVTLGTRQYKHRTILGRETMLTPAYWTDDGWLKVENGYITLENEISYDGQQEEDKSITIDMNSGKLPFEVIAPRYLNYDNIKFLNGAMYIKGNNHTLDETDECMIISVRQTEYEFEMSSKVSFYPNNSKEESGLVIMIDNYHHMSLFISKRNSEDVLILRKRVADIINEEIYHLNRDNKGFIELFIKGSKEKYYFGYVEQKGQIIFVGESFTKHLSSEACFSPFTGVVGGIYAIGNNKSCIKKFIVTSNRNTNMLTKII